MILSQSTRTVSQFIAECEQVLREKRTNPELNPPQPETKEEYDAFCDRWPEKSYMVRPADPRWLTRMGLSKHTGRTIEPFSIEWFERSLATVERHPKLARALKVLLHLSEAEVQHGAI
jgi:hypothetical protein